MCTDILPADPVLGEKFREALLYAAHLHDRQYRYGRSDIPYLGHLLSVAGMVIEAGMDEDTAVAALLHDSLDNQGGITALMDIRLRFGERVASIIMECSDALCSTPLPDWRLRKEMYLNHLEAVGTSPSALLVSLADKLHNGRCLVADLRQHGAAALDRYQCGRDETLWYYRSLLSVFHRLWNEARFEDDCELGCLDAAPGSVRSDFALHLLEELNHVVMEMEHLIQAGT